MLKILLEVIHYDFTRTNGKGHMGDPLEKAAVSLALSPSDPGSTITAQYDSHLKKFVITAHYNSELKKFVVFDSALEIIPEQKYQVTVQVSISYPGSNYQDQIREIDVPAPERAERDLLCYHRFYIHSPGTSVYYQAGIPIPYEILPDQISQGQRLRDAAGNSVRLTNSLLVEFKPEVDAKKARKIVTDICGAKTIKNFLSGLLGQNSYELQLDIAPNIILDKVNALQEHEEIVRAELNVALSNKPILIYTPAERQEPPVAPVEDPVIPTDTYFMQQMNYLNVTEVPGAWRRLFAASGNAFGDPKIVIGVLDASTVVKEKLNLANILNNENTKPEQEYHPDLPLKLEGRSRDNKIVGSWDMETKRTASQYPHAHAYGVTGIATACTNNGQGMSGIAGGCRLISVGYDRFSTILDRIKAMAWMAGIITNKDLADADTPPPPRLTKNNTAAIINNSWSMPNSIDVRPMLQKIAEQGRNGKGTLLVFAAFNDGQRIDYFDLHNNFYVINVAACSGEKRAAYSRWGDRVDLCAPSGAGISDGVLYTLKSDDPLKKTDYTIDDEQQREAYKPDGWKALALPGQLFGGTSGAAPQVTGALALALSANPDLTREQVVTLLRDSADHINYPLAKGEPHYPDNSSDPDFNGIWRDTDGDGIPDFSRFYGYGRLNTGRLVRLALLTGQHQAYFKADDHDDIDLFRRNGPAWDSPSLKIASDQTSYQTNYYVVARVETREPVERTPDNARVRFFMTDPTTLASTTYWQWLGDGVLHKQESGSYYLSDPIELPAMYNPSNKLLMAQLINWGHLPNLFDLMHPGDYATLVRWTGLLAWKQPLEVELRPNIEDTFTFYLGQFPEIERPWHTALRIELSQAGPGHVTLELSKNLLENVDLPIGVTSTTNDTKTTLTFSSQHAVYILDGLDLTGPVRSKAVLRQSYANSGQYTVTIGQYVDGHWTGLVKRQLKVAASQ